jgi:hypothetical protein
MVHIISSVFYVVNYFMLSSETLYAFKMFLVSIVCNKNVDLNRCKLENCN